MAKRTNRVAWGLAATLAVALLGTSGVFVATYQTGLSPQERLPRLLARNQWSFGSGGMAFDGTGSVVIDHTVRLGFFELPLRRTVSSR
jgi:hypothetical protein